MKKVSALRIQLEPPTSEQLFAGTGEPFGDFTGLQVPECLLKNAPLTCKAVKGESEKIPEVQSALNEKSELPLVVTGTVCCSGARLTCAADCLQWKSVSQTPYGYEHCTIVRATCAPRAIVLVPSALERTSLWQDICYNWWRACDGSGVLVRQVPRDTAGRDRRDFICLGTDVLLCSVQTLKGIMEQMGDSFFTVQAKFCAWECPGACSEGELRAAQELLAERFSPAPRVVFLANQSGGGLRRCVLGQEHRAVLGRKISDLEEAFCSRQELALPVESTQRVDVARVVLQHVGRKHARVCVLCGSDQAVQFTAGALCGPGIGQTGAEQLGERIAKRFLPQEVLRPQRGVIMSDEIATAASDQAWIKALSDADLRDGKLSGDPAWQGNKSTLIAIHVDLPASDAALMRRLVAAQYHIWLVGSEEPGYKLAALAEQLYRRQAGRVPRWLVQRVDQLCAVDGPGEEWLNAAADMFE